ncbi:hypothetical protein PoB_002482200 [Plakobranchus ocellatus]|uniref:Uncharacterized protein n=1 Tax=Plakobranchus ocellatus TaxID=259542 RepID=A0AAV3ZUU2_9GAST|nr:hypothetical protein PoB_002482200 [Plakobranchus ocellatus]
MAETILPLHATLEMFYGRDHSTLIQHIDHVLRQRPHYPHLSHRPSSKEETTLRHCHIDHVLRQRSLYPHLSHRPSSKEETTLPHCHIDHVLRQRSLYPHYKLALM